MKELFYKIIVLNDSVFLTFSFSFAEDWRLVFILKISCCLLARCWHLALFAHWRGAQKNKTLVLPSDLVALAMRFLTRPQSSSHRRYSAGRDGYREREHKVRWVGRKRRRKTTGKSWVEKLKVVSRVEKLCDAVSATFFTIDWFAVFNLLFGWFSFICLATVSVLSWLEISSKMASSGGDDLREDINLKEQNESIHEISIHGTLWNDSEFSVYIKIKIQFSQSKEIGSTLY